jgi:hypothetical protein
LHPLPAAPPVITHLCGDPFLEVEVAVRDVTLAGNDGQLFGLAPPIFRKTGFSGT